jgi:hypothetical protein
LTEGEAQAALAEIALQLIAYEDRLRAIRDQLPESPNREAMWEHLVPYDLATEIHATIECVLIDWLRAAIEYLEGAARVTDDDLRRRFERNRR